MPFIWIPTGNSDLSFLPVQLLDRREHLQIILEALRREGAIPERIGEKGTRVGSCRERWPRIIAAGFLRQLRAMTAFCLTTVSLAGARLKGRSSPSSSRCRSLFRQPERRNCSFPTGLPIAILCSRWIRKKAMQMHRFFHIQSRGISRTCIPAGRPAGSRGRGRWLPAWRNARLWPCRS